MVHQTWLSAVAFQRRRGARCYTVARFREKSRNVFSTFNMTGLFFTLQAAARRMVESGSGGTGDDLMKSTQMVRRMRHVLLAARAE
jgi:hypothetical protein